MNRISISETIHAAPEKVWDTMLQDATYRQWTSAFGDGSYFEGSWEKGSEIRFLTPGSAGMVAVIAESRPYEFLSIQHIGVAKPDGSVDTESESVKKWTPAFENYRFVATPEGTQVQVEMDVVPEFEAFMKETWPRALAQLKSLCEA